MQKIYEHCPNSCRVLVLFVFFFILLTTGFETHTRRSSEPHEGQHIKFYLIASLEEISSQLPGFLIETALYF